MEEDSADKYHIPLMNNLCNDHRMAMKSNLPTIFDIEEFRRKHYDTLYFGGIYETNKFISI